MHVALLRGINVGGKNKLPMKSLVEIFEREGCTQVATYIQSGNVLFRAKSSLIKRIASSISKAIEKRHGLAVPCLIRTQDELLAVVKKNPFLRAGVDPSLLYVAFLDQAPAKRNIASLDVERTPPDQFSVRGSEIYLHLPNGAGKTKFTNAYFDGKLAATSTIRNWRTVLTLLERMGDGITGR